MFLLRLSQGIFQGATMPSLTKSFFIFSEFSLVWERGIMLLLLLSQGISSGCHHSTPIFFGIIISVGKGHFASASTWPGYFFRVHHATPTTKKFFLCHYCGKGALCFDFVKVFLQVPPCHTYANFLSLWRGCIMLLLRLIQGNSSGSHNANLTPFFWNCHYCGNGALCFCFDLAKVFLQGATMPHLHPFFSELALLCEGCIILLLRISQGTSSGCHHATPTPTFFLNCRYFGKGALWYCFDLAKVFLQGETMPPLHTKNSDLSLFRKGHHASA